MKHKHNTAGTAMGKENNIILYQDENELTRISVRKDFLLTAADDKNYKT